jgi:hypothetical protein
MVLKMKKASWLFLIIGAGGLAVAIIFPTSRLYVYGIVLGVLIVVSLSIFGKDS